MKAPWDGEGWVAWLEHQPEPWRSHLKAAYDLGYYDGGEDARTDPSPDLDAVDGGDEALSLSSIGKIRLSEP